jgi:hypothetical protein
VLQLQQLNLREKITEKEKAEQGFVTVHHDLATLEKMHRLAPSVIIKDGEQVAAYALTMLRECRELIPELESMFSLLDKLEWKGKPLPTISYYVMGQVCVAKAYRGQGLFDLLFSYHKTIYQPRFELFVTEIATRNTRSIKAHERVGFRTIHTHRDEIDEWLVVAWDWN